MSRKFVKSEKHIGVSYQVLETGDRSYYITYKLAGKFHRIHIGKKSEGVNEAFCHQKRNEAINKARFGDDTPIVKHKRKNIVALNELAKVYFEDNAYENSSNTKQLGKYKLHIKPLFGPQDIHTIDRNDIFNFRNKLIKDKKAPKTVNGIIQLFTAIINYSIKNKELKVINPCTGIKRLKVDDERERFLTLQEINELKDTVKDDEVLYTFVLLSLITGARLIDILKIQKKDIDLTHSIVNLVDTKNKSTYRGFLDHESEVQLKKLHSKLTVNSFIVGGQNSLYPMRTLQRKLLKILDTLFNQGLDKKDTKNRVVIHTLRHTFASHLAINGTPIFTIQKLLNHSDIKHTMRYAKLAPDSGKDAIKGLYK